MALQIPTRITIEVHPPEPGGSVPQITIAAAPRDQAWTPVPYEPAPCTCLDDGVCAVDHAND